jgi:hypothetical protein
MDYKRYILFSFSFPPHFTIYNLLQIFNMGNSDNVLTSVIVFSSFSATVFSQRSMGKDKQQSLKDIESMFWSVGEKEQKKERWVNNIKNRHDPTKDGHNARWSAARSKAAGSKHAARSPENGDRFYGWLSL